MKSSMNTVLFVNATIGFSENLVFLVNFRRANDSSLKLRTTLLKFAFFFSIEPMVLGLLLEPLSESPRKNGSCL